MAGLKVNVHVTISGAVDDASQLQPVVNAISDALDKSCGDAHVNYNVFASTDAAIERKRKRDAAESY